MEESIIPHPLPEAALGNYWRVIGEFLTAISAVIPKYGIYREYFGIPIAGVLGNFYDDC
jgi:hypothetical protein